MYANEKEIFLTFCSPDRGRFQDRIELTFYDPAHTKRFAITRRISAIVGDKEDYEAIKATAPYVPKHKKVRERVGSIDEGPKPPAIAGIAWTVKLGLYGIDKNLERYLDMDDWKERMKCIRSMLPREVTCDTYARQFHTLLHIEEHKAA
jgi:helicase MOV-10